MHKIELFFKNVEKAALDLGKTPFPEIVVLTEYLSRNNLSKEARQFCASPSAAPGTYRLACLL